jgi:hypothetical protein
MKGEWWVGERCGVRREWEKVVRREEKKRDFVFF